VSLEQKAEADKGKEEGKAKKPASGASPATQKKGTTHLHHLCKERRRLSLSFFSFVLYVVPSPTHVADATTT
jgi:hypothetical protein